MARLRIKTKRTSLTISTRHAIRVGPFHGSYTERRSEEHTSELQSRLHLVCRLLLEKKKNAHRPLPATARSGRPRWRPRRRYASADASHQLWPRPTEISGLSGLWLRMQVTRAARRVS